LAKSLPDTASILIHHAQDKGADLLIIGAYSHFRLAQSVFGGTTRTLLNTLAMKLFMAH